jgi:hypothetical protein
LGFGRAGLRAGAIFFVEGFLEEFEGGPLHKIDLVVHAFLGLEDGGTDVSEARSALGRDFVGGEKLEEIAEDVVQVDLGEVIASGWGELGGEVSVGCGLVRGEWFFRLFENGGWRRAIRKATAFFLPVAMPGMRMMVEKLFDNVGPFDELRASSKGPTSSKESDLSELTL